jgi:pyruvate/2-oxoacid:ferredoxin oxidoreductase alpha subunit
MPIGLIKLRSFRPFPDRELRECLSNIKAIAILEKDVSIGAGGIIYVELSHCFNKRNGNPLLIDYILGLGGRDVTFEDIKDIALTLFKERDVDFITNPIRWYQVRGL